MGSTSLQHGAVDSFHNSKYSIVSMGLERASDHHQVRSTRCSHKPFYGMVFEKFQTNPGSTSSGKNSTESQRRLHLSVVDKTTR